MIRPLLSEGVGMVTISSTAAAADGPQAEQTATSGAVLVRDRVEVLEQIDQAVAQVDVAPRQISIQALVLAVRLNEKHEDGVDFDLLEQSGDVQPIGLPIDGADPLSAFLVQGSRLRCAVVEGTVAQLLDTLDAVGPTSAAATRRHVIAENQSATIDLADTSGLPLGARALKKPADPPLSSSIDRLEILPIASADGSVRLEIRGLAPQGSEGLSAAKRTVPTTTVVLPDATAVLVGGVVRHLADSDAERGSRPSLRRRAKPDLESFRGYETLVLLNVHLVTPTGREAPVAIVPADREARRPIAERYRVCAEAAAREGDSDRAANLVDLALRFDALDAEARHAAQPALDYGERKKPRSRFRDPPHRGAQPGKPLARRPRTAAAQMTENPMKDTRGSWTAIAAVGLLLIAVLGCAASRLSARRLTGRADPPPAHDEAAIEEFELDRDGAEFAAARASWQRGDAERCHHRLAHLLARNPQHEEAQLFAADVLLASGRPKDAASHLHRLIAIRPDNAKAQFALGRLLQDHGQPALAASYYQRAVELDPGNSEYLACRENASQAAESAEVAPSEQPPRGVTRTLVRSPAAAQTIAHATGDRGERAPEAATFAEPVETTRRPVDQASVQFPAPSAEAAPPSPAPTFPNRSLPRFASASRRSRPAQNRPRSTISAAPPTPNRTIPGFRSPPPLPCCNSIGPTLPSRCSAPWPIAFATRWLCTKPWLPPITAAATTSRPEKLSTTCST